MSSTEDVDSSLLSSSSPQSSPRQHSPHLDDHTEQESSVAVDEAILKDTDTSKATSSVSDNIDTQKTQKSAVKHKSKKKKTEASKIEIVETKSPETEKAPKLTKKPKSASTKSSGVADPAYNQNPETFATPIPEKPQVRQLNPEFIKNGFAFPVIVLLSNDTSKTVYVTDDFTALELTQIIADKLDLWQSELWSLCVQCNDGEGCRTILRESTAPQTNAQDSEQNDNKSDSGSSSTPMKSLAKSQVTSKTINVIWLDPSKTLGQLGISRNSQIYFRIKFFKHYIKLIDPIAITLFYEQINKEVLSGLYPAGSRIAVRLAALQMQYTYGDFNRSKHKPGYFTEDVLSLFLPRSTLENNDIQYVQQRIFFYHRRLIGTSKLNAALAYIEESRNIPTWGATWFEGKLQSYVKKSEKSPVNITKPKRIVIGVCEDGFVIPLKNKPTEEEQKKMTMSRKKLIDASRSTSIMNLDSLSATAEIGSLRQKEVDDYYEFFSFENTYFEENNIGLLLKKKKQECQLGLSTKQIDSILALCDNYMFMLAKQGWKDLDKEINLPPTSLDCPSYLKFTFPVDRSSAKKQSKSSKTVLELLKENYVQLCQESNCEPNPRLLLQIEAKLDEGTVLTALDMRRCKLDDKGFKMIADSLSATLKMAHVAKSGAMPFTEDFKALQFLFSYNDLKNPADLGDMACALQITHLDLRSNIITPEYAGELAKSLLKCISLFEFDISDNRIGNDGIVDIMNSLATLPSLKSVSISNVGISNGAIRRSISKISTGPDRGTLRNGGTGPEIGKVIANLLSNNNKLESLDISDNVLTARGIEFIVDVLEKQDGIRDRLVSLNVTNTHISGSVGVRLAKWCTKVVGSGMNHLKVLKVAANAFPEEACVCFSDLLAAGTVHLEDVDFSSLKMSSDCMASLIRGLANNKTVLSLNLSENDIPAKYSKDLGQALVKNMSLKKLGLRNCGMDKACLIAIADALSKNNNLEEIDLAGNKMDSRHTIEAWGTALKDNNTIKTLNLAVCQLDSDSLESLSEGLKHNRSLQILHLDGNTFKARGLKKLAHGIMGNNVIKIISLQDTDATARDMIGFLNTIGKTSGLNTFDLRRNPDLAKQSIFAESIPKFNHISIRYDK